MARWDTWPRIVGRTKEMRTERVMKEEENSEKEKDSDKSGKD